MKSEVAESPAPVTYADQLIDWLRDLGYTHCFFVGGGNIMYLLDSVRTRMECIPVVHEVAAGIAAEYFNEIRCDARAFAMVTAGPGLTNIVTAIGAAWLESRELLVIGGQAKTSHLARGLVRQVGHQEIDGAGIVSAITKESVRVERCLDADAIARLAAASWSGRPGPVFIECCLDVTGAPALADAGRATPPNCHLPTASAETVARLVDRLAVARRPILLLGGGVSWETAAGLWNDLEDAGLPCAATWNGADRVPDELTVSFGRPNGYGRRSSNVLLQQADLVIAVGTRLGLQQTGFATDRFVPSAYLVQVDIDPNELGRDTLVIDEAILADGNQFLSDLVMAVIDCGLQGRWNDWLDFGRDVQATLPAVEAANTGESTNPLAFIEALSDKCVPTDVVIPCSSGHTFLTTLQCFRLKCGQRMVTDKGSASMGYGLSGAIGAAFAAPARRVIHLEGDGGFAQNLQELGTVRTNNLNIKMFLFVNTGYASIRQMQERRFGGSYIGCDESTGLGLPSWQELFASYGIQAHSVPTNGEWTAEMIIDFDSEGPVAFVVNVDPEQTYWPKILSRSHADGTMTSDPLHLMHPPLAPEVDQRVLRFIDPDAKR